MDWTATINGYCERTDSSLWSEPINALTNVAFLVAALVMWRRTGPGRAPIQAVLIVLLFAIGIGSALFHTFATIWALLTDVLPIGLYILAYVYAANRDYWGMEPGPAGLATLILIPYMALAGAGFAALPFFAISAAYWPVASAIALYGLALLGRTPTTGVGLLAGAAILTVSLAARSVDETLCDAIPSGTHWLWHLLNGLMLGWMIEVHRRHVGPLEGRAGER